MRSSILALYSFLLYIPCTLAAANIATYWNILYDQNTGEGKISVSALGYQLRSFTNTCLGRCCYSIITKGELLLQFNCAQLQRCGHPKNTSFIPGSAWLGSRQQCRPKHQKPISHWQRQYIEYLYLRYFGHL